MQRCIDAGSVLGTPDPRCQGALQLTLRQIMGSPNVLRQYAAAGRAEVLVDGGILRGTDVIKAVARGARAVGVGKLQGLALAAAGEAGIARMLELLALEIRTMMGLMGVTSLAQLNPSWVRPAQPVSCASITSAYPCFEELTRRFTTPG